MFPSEGLSTVGIGDKTKNCKSISTNHAYFANEEHRSKENKTSETNEIAKQNNVAQITMSESAYSADRVTREESPRKVEDNQKAENEATINGDVTSESTALYTSANSVYNSMTKEEECLKNIIKHSTTTTINKVPANSMHIKSKIVDNDNGGKAFYATAIEKTIAKLTVMFPEQVTNNRIDKLAEIVIEGYKLADNVYTAKDTEEWGNKYKVPDPLVQSDKGLLKASMRDINVMVARRQKKLISNRLNANRVQLHTHADNPERNKLFLLAEKGMSLLQRESFKANGKGKIPPLRITYTSVKSAVNRLL